jgi:DDE family transposase
MSSDRGLMALFLAERRLGMAHGLPRCILDGRDPPPIAHTVTDMVRALAFAICRRYEDADDVLRSASAFKFAYRRLPDSGRDQRTQTTQPRLANAPQSEVVLRLTYALLDQWMTPYAMAASSVMLDIDGAWEAVPSDSCFERQPA